EREGDGDPLTGCILQRSERKGTRIRVVAGQIDGLPWRGRGCLLAVGTGTGCEAVAGGQPSQGGRSDRRLADDGEQGGADQQPAASCHCVVPLMRRTSPIPAAPGSHVPTVHSRAKSCRWRGRTSRPVTVSAGGSVLCVGLPHRAARAHWQ